MAETKAFTSEQIAVEPDVLREWRLDLKQHRNCDSHDKGCMLYEECSVVEYVDGLQASIRERDARTAKYVDALQQIAGKYDEYKAQPFKIGGDYTRECSKIAQDALGGFEL